MAAANGLARGDYDELAGGVAATRFAALKAGVADAAFVLPPLNFQANAAGYATLGYSADYVKDLPFTGMVVRKSWAAANGALAKRLLAATDKSIAWLADEAHRGEAIDVLVNAAHAKPDDAAASYDLLQRVQYFESTGKVSRKKLQNLIDAEHALGMVDVSLTPERLVMPGVTQMMD